MLPALGQLKVREVRRRYIKPWLSSLKQRGLAPDTVRLAKAALSALLSHATDEELIDTNPALQLGRTKGAHAGKLTKADREEHIRPFESVQQRDEFLNAAAKYRPDAAAFEVMAKAGLRPGEAYALQPDDLNLKMRTMRVERALDLDKTVKRTKTYERRTVRLSSSLVQSLKRHLIWLKSQALVRGWVEVQWLFPTEVNTPLDESRAKKVFAPVRRPAFLTTAPTTFVTPRHPDAHGRCEPWLRQPPVGAQEPGDDLSALLRVDSQRGRPSLDRHLGTRFWNQDAIGHPRCFGSARCDWWAVKDSNLGPAD